MSFEENIQQWVAIDNQIKRYNSEVKELRSKEIIYRILSIVM